MAPAVKFKIKQMIDNYIHSAKVMVFSKSYCPACLKVKQLFESLGVAFTSIELDQIDNGAGIQEELASMTGQNTVPNIFVNGKHTGGCDDTVKLHSEGKLMNLINPPKKTYDYDLVVIGGGSGGLAASKEAAKLGKKVAVCDFVKPTPKGTTWGLGGTCVNVGCIPKKLMHQAAILSHEINDAKSFGWEMLHEDNEVCPVHKWNNLVMNVQNYIGSLNWGYKVALRSNNVTYLNAFATFMDPHKIKTIDNKGKESYITSEKFILAMGGRPKYPENVPGASEYGITSDDLFSLNYCPGKVLLVGASYISLECAGFLHGLGCDVTVMVRSILLRGFDQQMANLIGEHMESMGIKFIRECVPIKIEEVRPNLPGVPGMFKVSSTKSSGEVLEDEFNTVIFAVGREPCTQGLGLEVIGMKVNPKNGKVFTNDHEQTSVENIYAIGDILDGKPELTPMAIQSGVLLARRLFGSSTLLTDYSNVPTTVFTPLEYGCCGMSEEAAIEKYGLEDIEVYHSNFKPLEFALSNRDSSTCYAKLVCVKSLEGLVVGIHYLGPNAGEVIQGYSLGLKLGAKKSDFDNLVGIHPTTAEVFTTLNVTKASGEGIMAAGC